MESPGQVPGSGLPDQRRVRRLLQIDSVTEAVPRVAPLPPAVLGASGTSRALGLQEPQTCADSPHVLLDVQQMTCMLSADFGLFQLILSYRTLLNQPKSTSFLPDEHYHKMLIFTMILFLKTKQEDYLPQVYYQLVFI